MILVEITVTIDEIDAIALIATVLIRTSVTVTAVMIVARIAEITSTITDPIETTVTTAERPEHTRLRPN